MKRGRSKPTAIDELYEAILCLETKEECAAFFDDICTVLELQTISQRLQVAKMLREHHVYADIVSATRYPDHYQLNEWRDLITFGGSPRASISLAKAARAYAFIKRRGYVVPEDVRAVAHDVLRHRIGLSYEAEASNVNSEEIISKIINKVEVP